MIFGLFKRKIPAQKPVPGIPIIRMRSGPKSPSGKKLNLDPALVGLGKQDLSGFEAAKKAKKAAVNRIKMNPGMLSRKFKKK